MIFYILHKENPLILVSESICLGNCMDALEIILDTFKKNEIKAGQTLDKKLLMLEINKLPQDEKLNVRNAWHTLVGNGLIVESNPIGPTLTSLGEEMIYSE